MDYPKSDPTVGLVGGKFTDGDPAGAVPPSRDPASWANLTTDELLNILTAFGVTPAEANNHQLIDALLANFANIGGNASQLFRALTANQFDNSTYVATTEFVQRALGNRQGVVEMPTSATLAAADMGKTVFFYGTGATATLPGLASVPLGAEIEFFSLANNNNTVARAGTDAIYVNNSTVTSLTIGQGGSLRLVARTNGWAAVGGSAQLYAASKEFGSSLATNGYQKLPSGLIVQWGTIGTSSTADVAVTFPISFPTAAVAISINPNATTIGEFACHNTITTTGFMAASWSSTSARIAAGCLWVAIGY
jgi:hypothetical protein